MILEMVFPLKCIIITSKRYLLEMTALIKLEHSICLIYCRCEAFSTENGREPLPG